MSVFSSRLFLGILIIALCFPGCRRWKDDPALTPQLQRSDMQTLVTPPEDLPKKKKAHKNTISEVLPVDPLLQKPVSIQIGESLNLKQAFMELARQTGVDLQLDPSIDAHIVFGAKHRALIDVIRDMCELAELRFQVKGKSIRIQKDTPYPQNYNVQFLNLSRQSQNRTAIATDVFGQNPGTNTTAHSMGENGSSSSVNETAQSNFWNELENNLKILLGQGQASYAIHKQGGLISVTATDQQHQLLQKYLQTLRKAVSSQVLIEAKVVEVNLTDEYRSGINWNKVMKGSMRVNAPLGTISSSGSVLNPAATQNDILNVGFSSKSFNGLLQAIEQFGIARTLSSPRLTVMNNQTAILKIAQNQVYFRLNYDKQFNLSVNRESVSVSSDIQTVPIGLVMSVQPSIDLEKEDIILSLRPTISRLSRSVRDPAVDIAFNANSSTAATANTVTPKPSLVPVVEVREIDSILRLKSGEIAVLGGLMEVRTRANHAQMPYLGDAPLLGNLFKGTGEGEEIVELVILLKATIADEQGSMMDATDERLLKDYTLDPRPFVTEES